jgi:hypothetical protein
MTRDGRRRGADELVEIPVVLTPEQVAALLQLCDAVPLRGPASKVLVAGAQAALVEALREDQPGGGSSASPQGGPQK